MTLRDEVVHQLKLIDIDFEECKEWIDGFIDSLVTRIAKIQKHSRIGCMYHSGIDVWIRSRVRDETTLMKGGCKEPESFVSGVLHFWSWDEEKYGPAPGKESSDPKVARQTLQELVERCCTPIDRVSHKVAGQ